MALKKAGGLMALKKAGVVVSHLICSVRARSHTGAESLETIPIHDIWGANVYAWDWSR